METTTRLPVVETSLWKLSIVPVLISTISIVTISLSIDPDIALLWDICTSSSSPYPELSDVPVIGIPCCTLSTFFASTVATALGQIFMSVFLSFITALITTTMVESQRQDETPNVVVRYPAGSWLLVNVVSGAVVAPLVMAPASFYHSKTCLRKRQDPSRIASGDGLPNRAVRAQAKLAIPLSVTGGFIIPSIILIFAPSPTIVILWQFFPIYVAILFRLLTIIVSQLPPTLLAVSQRRSIHLLFTIPILLSILSHVSLIIYVFSLLLSQRHDDGSPLTTSALHVLAINFLTIFITLIYWLYIEGGTSTARAGLKWTLLVGPGAGVCFGWIAREEAMRAQIMMDSRIEGEERDENAAGRVDGDGDPARTASRADGDESSKALIDDDEESTPESQPLLTGT